MMGFIAGCGGGAGAPNTPPMGTSQARLKTLAIVPSPSPASASEFVGTWTGTAQEMQPVAVTFTLTMTVQQGSGNTLTGTFTDADGAYYQDVAFTGSVAQGVFTLKLTSVVDETAPPPGFGWCGLPGGGTLTLSSNGNTMSGPWSAAGCDNGTLTLQRATASPAPSPSSNPCDGASPAPQSSASTSTTLGVMIRKTSQSASGTVLSAGQRNTAASSQQAQQCQPLPYTIFIGGLADQTKGHAVLNYSKGISQDIPHEYFAHTQESDIAARIQSLQSQNPARAIIVVGHSYGGDTAAHLAGNPNLHISYLITADPVGEKREDTYPNPHSRSIQPTAWEQRALLLVQSVSKNIPSSQWIDVDALGTSLWPPTNGNALALAGGKWDTIPKPYTTFIPATGIDHADFCGLMEYTSNGISAQSLLKSLYPAYANDIHC
jgi:hypothetical protein